MLIRAENVSIAMTRKKLVVKKDQFSLLMALMLMARLQRVDILATSLSMKGKYFCNLSLFLYFLFILLYIKKFRDELSMRNKLTLLLLCHHEIPMICCISEPSHLFSIK